MLKFVILLTALGCALGATIPQDKTPQVYGNGSIAGGVPTTINAFPWMAAIQRYGSYVCSGAIYNNKVIVTAAHCLQGLTTSALSVRVGSNYSNTGGYVYGVAAFRIHEGFNTVTLANDVAVMRLNSSLNYGNTIYRINLSSNHPVNGVAAVVSSWDGVAYGYGASSNNLTYVDVQMITSATCASNSYNYGSNILPSMFCATTPTKDACQGYSGGPLVSGGRLYGIVSWGYDCDLPNYPGVYANVPYMHSWITDAANNV